MSKKIFLKTFIFSVLVFILLGSFCVPTSYALGDVFSQGKGFLEAGDSIDETINKTALQETSDTIYNTLLAFAIMVAIVVGMVLGIQFMVASADEKAKVKEALIPFVIGCVVVFGSFTIWKIVVNIGNNAEDAIEAKEISPDTSKKCFRCGSEIYQSELDKHKCDQCGYTL